MPLSSSAGSDPNVQQPNPSIPVDNQYGFGACMVNGAPTLYVASNQANSIAQWVYDIDAETWSNTSTISLSALGLPAILSGGNISAISWMNGSEILIRIYYTTTSGFQEITGNGQGDWAIGEGFTEQGTVAVSAITFLRPNNVRQLNVYTVSNSAVLNEWSFLAPNPWTPNQIASGSQGQYFAGVAAVTWNVFGSGINIRAYVQVNSGGSGSIQEYAYGPSWTTGASIPTNIPGNNLTGLRYFDIDGILYINVFYAANSTSGAQLGYAAYSGTSGTWSIGTIGVCDQDSNVAGFLFPPAFPINVVSSESESLQIGSLVNSN